MTKSFFAVAAILVQACSGGATDSSRADADAAAQVETCTGAGDAVNQYVEVLNLGGTTCLPRKLQLDASYTAPCKLLEASSGATCRCPAGREPVSKNTCAAAHQALASAGLPASDCICALEQAEGAAMTACQSELTPANTVDGWCILDRTCSRNDALFADCQATQPSKLRFLGNATPAAGVPLLIACVGVPLGTSVCPSPP